MHGLRWQWSGIACAVVLLCALLVPRDAAAYSFCFQAENGRVLHWKRTSFPLNVVLHKDGAPGVDFTALTQVVQLIFQGWGSFDCTYARLTGGAKAPADNAPVVDGVNMIKFITSGQDWQWSPGAVLTPIITSNTRTGEIRDADLLLNAWKFQFSTNPQGGAFDLQSVLNHGIGRVLGLCESASATATMYGRINPEETGKRQLSEDDKRGLCDLYPKDSPCKEGEMVGNNAVCFNGRVSPLCPPYSPICLECRSDADCRGAGNFCLFAIDSGRCGTQCGVGGACPQGFQCITVTDDSGQEVGKNCAPDTSTCAGAPALPCCRTSDDCLPGFSCVLQMCQKGSTSDPCQGKCATHEQCDNGTCVARGCTNDAQCGVGWKCVNSRCAPSGDCVNGCPTGQECKDSKCVAVGGTSCTNDGDCSAGLKCALGGGIRLCTSPCVSAQECANGFFCVAGLSGVTSNGCWPASRSVCGSTGTCTPAGSGGCAGCSANQTPPVFEGLLFLLIGLLCLSWRRSVASA